MIVAGPVIGVETAAAAHGLARQRHSQVLEQERHSAERALGQARLDPFTGPAVESVHQRIQGRIHRLGTGGRRIEQFAGRHFPRGNQSRESGRIVPGIVVEVHDPLPE